MLIVPDVQDVYTPLQTDVVVQLSEVSLNSEIFSLEKKSRFYTFI